MPPRRETLGSGRFLRLVKVGRWEFAERTNASGAVAIIATTPDRRLVLTEQFRPAVGQWVIDLPAGLAGDQAGTDEEPLVRSAQRELLEETGYAAKSWKQVAACCSSPGLSSEVITYFLVRNVLAVGEGGGVDHEEIKVHIPALRTIRPWLARQIRAGKLIDAKVYLGLYFATSNAR